MMMMGSAGQRVFFTVTEVRDTKISPATAACGISFLSDGSITVSGNNSSASTAWVIPVPPQTTYYIKLDFTGDAPTGGSTTGTVLSLATSRSWTWSVAASVTRSANCTVSVYADAGGTSLLRSVSFNATAESIV